MSKVIKFEQEQKTAPQRGASGKTAAEKAAQEEFLSYESIWKMTDGGVTDADEQVLQRIKAQYGAAEKKARDIVLAAQAEAGRIEQEAYHKGFEEGRREGEEIGRQKFESVVQPFSELFTTLASKSIQVDQALRQNLVELVKVMADRLVGHEISASPEVIANCLAEALSFVDDNVKVRVRLNPEDYKNINEFGLQVAGMATDLSRLVLVEDPSVSVGGCLLNTDYGEVDATLESRRDLLFAAVDRAFAEIVRAAESPPEKQPEEQEDEKDPWLL